jgi:hypothetical protein
MISALFLLSVANLNISYIVEPILNFASVFVHKIFQRSSDVLFFQHESDWKMPFDIAKENIT